MRSRASHGEQGGRRRTNNPRKFRVDCAAANTRPYTVRKGDTLFSICSKRGIQMQEVKSLNPKLKENDIREGQTIALPSRYLSLRDLNILQGINLKGSRNYPVREGETIQDIIGKRGITMDEARKVNPNVNLYALKEGQVIQLPAGKYTKREKEMMMGSGIVPSEFFESTGTKIAGLGVLLLVTVGVYVAIEKIKDTEEPDA